MYGIEGLLAGRTLVGRYRIEEVIGRGGMGAVYLATDERLGRQVAVKIISVAAPDPDAHTRLRARFHREARAAARLHHPNVVAVYDFGTDPTLDLDFLVMELLRGEDLASRLNRKGPPALPDTLRILHQAARGLAAGHRAGLIHRDVKPGNLHLEPGDRPGDLRVRVLDFGIAEITADDQTVTHLTVAGHSPFSPAYASPEQLRGDSRVTPASDVFSLGAVGYYLAFGERAFTSSDPHRMAAELSASLASLRGRSSSLPPPLGAVLQRALAHDPRDRFPDADAFADALAPGSSTGEAHTAPPEATEWAGSAEPRREPTRDPTREGTRWLSGTGRRDRPVPRGSPPDGFPGAERRPEPVAARSPYAGPPPAGEPAGEAEPRPGIFRRAATALWNFCLTCVAIGLFAGSWALAISGLGAGNQDWMYAGIAGSIAFAPLAVHRVMGRRGSFRLALAGSVAASIAAVVIAGPEGNEWRLLATMFVLQLITSLVVVRLTRARRRPRPPEPQHTPAGA